MRIEAGLTQSDLADRAGVDSSTLSRLENGVRTHPAPRITRNLAEALGVPLTALLAVEHVGAAA